MKERNVTLGLFIGCGLVVALALAFFISPQASSKPDGLNKVAIDKGFNGGERASHTDGSPVAGYAVKGVGNDRLATGLAGIIGVGVVFVLALGGAALARRTGSRPGGDATAVHDGGHEPVGT